MYNPPRPLLPLFAPLPVAPELNSASVQQLMAMGFKREDALNALKLAEGNLDGAVQFLAEAAGQPDRDAMMLEPAKPAPANLVVAGSVKTYARLLGDKEKSDVIFVVGKAKEQIPAYKAMLANCSKVFERMFFSESKMKEATSSPVLQDVEPEEFKAILEFCYICRVDHLEFKKALRLYMLADQFMMDDFKQYLETFIVKSADKTNALTLYELTKEEHIFEKLHKAASDLICVHANDILQSEGVLNRIPKESVLEILRLPLQAFESIIMARIIEFVLANAGKDETKKQMRVSAKAILSLVNLKKLGAEGLRSALTSQLFRKGDLLAAVLGDRKLMGEFKEQYHVPPRKGN